MSGGHFDYLCFGDIGEFSIELEREIEKNDIEDEEGYCRGYSAETIEILKKCSFLFREVSEMAHAIEWCYSDDTGEEDMVSQIRKSLEKIGKVLDD